MAAVIGALRAELSATIARFQEDMKNAGAAVRDFATKAEAQGKRVQRIGRNISLALTAPLVAFGVKSVQAAQESAQALGQLDAALKSTEHQAGRTLKQLQAQAKALESISTFDDDDILKGVTTNLTKFGNVVGEVFDKAQLAIVNMASRTGDLGAATQTIGRALNDPIQGINALTRAGVQFTNQEKDQIKALVTSGRGIEAQALILQKLERAYGGAAKALRDATPGAALNQQWRELTEIVGGILIDVLPPVIDLLRGIAEAFNSLSPGMQRITVYAGLFAAALGPVTFAIGGIMRAAAALTPVVTRLAFAIGAISVATWGWIAAIAAAVAALVIFWKSVKDILHGDFEKAWEDAKTTAREMWTDLQLMFSNKPIQAPIEFKGSETDVIKPGTPKFSMPTEVLAGRKAFETDLRQMGEKISSAFRKVELPAAVTAAADLNAQIDEMITKAKAAGVNTAAWANELQGLRDRIESLKLAGLAKEAREFGRDVAENELAVRRFASGSLDPLNEELATVDQAYEQLRLKIEAQIEDNAELAKVSDTAAAAMDRLQKSLVDLEAAHAAAREAAVTQYRAEQDLATIQSERELRGGQREIEDLQRARGDFGFGRSNRDERLESISRSLTDREVDVRERIAKLELDRAQAEAKSDFDALERINQEISVQQQLRDLIHETSAAQLDAAQRFKDVWDGFFDDVESEFLKMAKEGKFTFDGLRSAIREMLIDAFVKPHIEQAGGLLKTAIAGGLSGIGGQIGDFFFPKASFDAGSGNWTPGPGGFPEMATGGFVPPNQWAIAGETGEAELVFGGKRGATVFSPDDSRGMMRGGGQTIVNQNINTTDVWSFMRTSRQVARQTKRALQEG